MYYKFIKLKKHNVIFGLLSAIMAFSGNMMAQLSGTKVIGTDYPTLSAAVADINAQGVNGPLVINIPAGFTETAPVGGYSLTATGTAANTITFQKSGAGANPLLTAYATGTATPTSAIQDGVFRLIGSDYVTIDQIDIVDNNAANPATMEYGYALYKESLNDGCQNNTIKNCVITLNRINNAGSTAPMVEGSAGIIVMNATAIAATTVLTPTAAIGTNSNNKFYSNTIQNCNYGIAIIGFAASSPFTAADFGNDIGGSSSATGNTIINYGGGATTSPAAAVRTLAQYGLNVSYNTVNNNNGSGVNHGTTLRGIYVNTATSANASITNNTVTVKSAATINALTAIENTSGSTAASNTITISNNVITNCSYTTATSGTFSGILQSSSAANIVLNNNTISGSVIGASGVGSSATFQGIYSSTGSGTNPVSISSNTVTNNVINNQGGTMYCLRATTSAITVSNNAVNNNSFPLTGGTLGSTIYGYYNLGSPTIENYLNNAIDNLVISGSSTSTGSSIYGTYSNTSSSSNLTISGNNVHTLTFNNSSTGSGIVYGMYHTRGSFSLSKNKIYDLTANGASSTVFGLTLSGANIAASNNIIGDIKAPSATGANAVVGINVIGGGAVNIYYNTVYLSGSSSGTNFGSSAIFVNATPTTVNLNNNIFVNNSTPTGTGISAAFRKSSSSLANIGTASNNNLYYAGTPGATNAIFYDGTTVQQTLANYKTLLGPTREAMSVTENPTFASTTGSSATFLHFNAGTGSAAESGGANIATYADDFDGDIRQGNAGYVGTGTSPDMGADEFSGTSPAPGINSVSITPTGSQCTAIGRTVTANITPASLPLTSVVLNYSFDGVAQPTVVLTGGNASATSNWTGSIPVASPANASVTWFVTTTDGAYTKITNGPSYSDEPTSFFVATASVTPSPVCAGSTATLSLNLSSPNTPTYCAIPAATSASSYFDGFSTTGGVANITNNASGFSANGYGSFTNLVVSQKVGQAINFNTVLAGATVGVAMWVDWNQNGVFDASEVVYNTTSYVSTAAGSFTVPATAKLGITRMRIYMDFSNSNPSGAACSAFTFGRGEAEDYTFMVSPATISYAWSDGVTTFTSSTNSSTLTVNASSTYTGTVLLDGCPLSSTVQVNSTPIPAAPTVTNSSQCGNGTPTALVGGGSTYAWYATPTSTTALQTGASQTYTNSISTTTTFYVSSVSGICESPRTAVMASVTQPDAVTAVTTASNICPAGSVTLTAVQTGTTNLYAYSWVATPVAGSGLSSSVPGQSISVSPTAPGTYVYNVTATDGVCTTTAAVSVTLNNPPTITATANPAVICSGSSVSLNATTPIISTGTVAIGTGTNLTASGSSDPTAFCNRYTGYRMQAVYTAAELNAAGLSAGNITSIAYNVSTLGDAATNPLYTVKCGTTSVSAFTDFISNAGFTTVFPAATYTHAVGVNVIPFSTPFNWDGVSNLVVEVTHNGADLTNNSLTYYTPTAGNTIVFSNYNNATGNPGTKRLNIIFGGQVAVQSVGSLTWQWNPGTINSNTTTVIPVNSGSISANQVYTISATNTITTCSNTATVAVLVHPLPSAPVAVNSTQCGLAVPTASVSGGTFYTWYATPTSTTVLQAGASATFTALINNTTTWYVTSFNGICESTRAAITASVTIPDAVTAASTATAICPGSTFTLTATKSGTLNTYTYTWTASPATGSGIAASASGATTAVTPTTAGTYNYLVTAVDGVCTTTASVNVIINPAPNISNAMTTPTMVCSGSSVGLSATVTSSINVAWNPGSIPTNTATLNPVNAGSTAVTQIYTITATNPATGCVNTATTGVIVNPIPGSPVTFNSTQCGVAIPTASVTGGTSYKWYATATSTNAIQGGTSQTYTSSISTTTNLYVSSFDGNCESSRTMVTASVTVPDGVTASAGTATICPNTTVTLTAAKIGTANTYSYTWTGSPVGSGIPVSVGGVSVVVTPTLSGTFIYTVTAVDGVCTAVATASLQVYQAITTPPLTSATPNPLCAGNSTTLSATFGNTLSPTYALPPSVSFATSDEDIGSVTFGPLNNSSAVNTLVGTIGAAAGVAGSYSNFTAFGPYAYTIGSTYTLSLSSLQQATAYSNAFGVYIDYNRNGSFADAGEAVYVSSATTSGAHTETTTVTIPSSASVGITRMRIICSEGLVTGPVMSVFFGEYEEYTLNMLPNITYNWTNGVTTVGTTNPLSVSPTSNTTYSFTATDGNGCMINSTPVTVTVAAIPVVTAAASSTASCASSPVTLTAGGATTYSWMPAGGSSSVAVVNPTTSTIYTVTGTSLGCSSTNTLAINVTPTPTVVASASPSVICAGATLTLTANGATTYSWMPNSSTSASVTASPTVSTIYTVSGTASGCTNTKTLTVTVNNIPTLTVTTNPAGGALCTTGATATLTAAGTSTAYAWSNSANTASTSVAPSATTVYSVSGTNSCGTTTTTVTIAVATTPTIAAASSSTLSCAGNQVVLTATATPGVTYSWNTGASTMSVSVSPSVTTTYTVTGSNACGTATATIVQNVSPCTGIEVVSGGEAISIYPNPASDYVNIAIPASLASGNTSVEVTDALGKLVMKETLNTDVTTLRISKLEDGVYFFKVTTNNQVIKVGKIVKH